MATAGPLTRARNNLTGIVSTAITGIWLAALFTGQDWWLAFMLFGYIAIVPLVAVLFGDTEDIREWWDDEEIPTHTTTEAGTEEQPQDDALETLRKRYARGELTDEQFERKVDQLLETETLEHIEDDNRETEPERSQ